MRTCTRLFVALLFGASCARSQYWEADDSFAPVLESATIPGSLYWLVGAPAGKLYVSPGYAINGVQTALARLNADGSIDRTFGPAFGVAAVYADGRVLATEQANANPDSFGTQLRRLYPDGSADDTFKPVFLETGTLNAAQILADGRILLVGSFLRVNGTSAVSLCVLNGDGTIHSGFHSPFTTPVGSGDLGSLTAAASADGKIYTVVGPFSDLGSEKLRRIARLNSDGSIDPTFNANNTSLPSLAQRGYPQADGRVLVSYGPGWMAGADVSGLVRLDASGALDPTFTPAIVGTRAGFGPQQSDGKIVYSTSNDGTTELRRINADGTADPTFILKLSPAVGGFLRPVLADDGTYFFGSPITAERHASGFEITHVLANGVIDPNYNPRLGAKALTDAFVRQADGQVIVAGAIGFANGRKIAASPSLIRFAATGALDETFRAPLAAGETVARLRAQPGGKIVASGTLQVGGEARTFARFNADGTRDAAFRLSGPSGTAFELDASGRIYAIAPDAGGVPHLVRYTAEGAPDASFARVPLFSPSRFAVWPDGSVVATTAGQRDDLGVPRTTLSRFLADGTREAVFAVNPSDLPNDVIALAAIPGGSVVAIGTDNVRDGSEVMSYVRFGPTGTVDYRYGGRVSASVDMYIDPEEVGGVLFDALHETAAPTGSRVRVDLNGIVSVEVDDAGHLFSWAKYAYGATALGLQRRSSLTSPSVNPAPVVVATWNADPGSVAIGGTTTLSAAAGGLSPLSYQWQRNGNPIPGATSASYKIESATLADAGDYTVVVTNAHGAATSTPLSVPIYDQFSSPAFMTLNQPMSRTVMAGNTVYLSAGVLGNPLPALEWFRNDEPLTNPNELRTTGRMVTNTDLELSDFQPTDSGIYYVRATNPQGSVISFPAIIGAATSRKVVGYGREIGANIVHPNGKQMDQILLEGAVASLTADPGQVTRLSFIDLNNDIVQVEFTGAGTLTVRLSEASGPAAPALYVQPGVNYMKGHATIVVIGADETTNLSVFSVGRANAVNQSLFPGDVTYDGVADIACIAILSDNGQFGGLRCANVSFFASHGLTGVYAPTVQFNGPVYVGDINAFDRASPTLRLGWAYGDTLITGGDLSQNNGRAIDVFGITQLKFTAGTTSQGTPLPAQHNRAQFRQNGIDVTSQIVVNP